MQVLDPIPQSEVEQQLLAQVIQLLKEITGRKDIIDETMSDETDLVDLNYWSRNGLNLRLPA